MPPRGSFIFSPLQQKNSSAVVNTSTSAKKTKKRPLSPSAVALIAKNGEKTEGIMKSYLYQAGVSKPILSGCRKTSSNLLGDLSGTPRRGVERVSQQDKIEEYQTRTPKKRRLHLLPVQIQFTINGNVSPIYQLHSSVIKSISSSILSSPKKINLSKVIAAAGGPPKAQDENNVVTKRQRVYLGDIERVENINRLRFEFVMGGQLSNDCAFSAGLPVSEEEQYEYGHLIAHVLGGKETADNVALMSRSCNRFMATIERKIKNLLQNKTIDYCDIEVKARYMKPTDKYPNMYPYIADAIEYSVTLSNGNKINFHINALCHDFWPEETSTHICNLIQAAAVSEELTKCIDTYVDSSPEQKTDCVMDSSDYTDEKPTLARQLIGQEEQTKETKKRRRTSEVSLDDSDIVNVKGLVREKVKGDGSCFYHAVGAQIGVNDPQILRNSTADYIEANKDLFLGFLEKRTRRTSDQKKISDYISGIRKNAWADNMAIVALMQVLHREIVIIGPDGAVRSTGGIHVAYDNPPIFVFYNGFNHYDAARLEEGYSAQTVLSDLQSVSSSSDQEKSCSSSGEASLSPPSPPRTGFESVFVGEHCSFWQQERRADLRSVAANPLASYV